MQLFVIEKFKEKLKTIAINIYTIIYNKNLKKHNKFPLKFI
jgi:hypothetical protein